MAGKFSRKAPAKAAAVLSPFASPASTRSATDYPRRASTFDRERAKFCENEDNCQGTTCFLLLSPCLRVSVVDFAFVFAFVFAFAFGFDFGFDFALALLTTNY